MRRMPSLAVLPCLLINLPQSMRDNGIVTAQGVELLYARNERILLIR